MPTHPNEEAAQKVAALAERNGWRLLMDLSRPAVWVKLELWRGDEYLQLNWSGNDRAKLSLTRNYKGPSRRPGGRRRDTRSFTFWWALQVIQAPPR